MDNELNSKPKYDFTEEISSGKKIDEEATDVSKEDFYSAINSFSQSNSYNNKPASFFQSFFKKIDDANDKFSTISFRLKRKKRRSFNNGEPVSSAVKKFFIEFTLVLLIAGVFLGINFAMYTLKNKLSDVDVTSLSVSRSYIDEQSVDLTYYGTNNSVTATLNCISAWTGNNLTTYYDEDISDDDMKDELENILNNHYVTTKTDMSNLELLEEIYQSLKDNSPVIVKILGEDYAEFTYAIVEEYNANDKLITLNNANGITEIMSVDKFLDLTRYEYYELSFSNKIGLIFGKYCKNTAFFFNEDVS